MGQFEPASAVIRRTLSNFGGNLQREIICRSIFQRWHEIAGNFSKSLLPLRIDGKNLILCAKNSVAKDNVKFIANTLVNNINEKIGQGEQIIETVSLGKSFEQPDKFFERNIILPKKNNSPARKISNEINSVVLTDEEFSDCQKKVSAIQDESRREFFLQTFIAHAKTEKWKIQNGWHKCRNCDTLCPAEDIFCGVCEVNERGKVRQKIRRIFMNEPWSTFRDVKSRLEKIFPHMKEECTFDVIESERASLIRETAASLSTNSSDSKRKKFLVMLFRRLREEALTEAIINRALKDLRFNLAERFPAKS